LVAENSVDEITKVREPMNQLFLLIDQGELELQVEYYLGVEVSQIDQDKFLLHQTPIPRKYLKDLR
jgi:hypothetical protein